MNNWFIKTKPQTASKFWGGHYTQIKYFPWLVWVGIHKPIDKFGLGFYFIGKQLHPGACINIYLGPIILLFYGNEALKSFNIPKFFKD